MMAKAPTATASPHFATKAQERRKDSPRGHLQREGSGPVPCSLLPRGGLPVPAAWAQQICQRGGAACQPEVLKLRQPKHLQRQPSPDVQDG